MQNDQKVQEHKELLKSRDSQHIKEIEEQILKDQLKKHAAKKHVSNFDSLDQISEEPSKADSKEQQIRTTGMNGIQTLQPVAGGNSDSQSQSNDAYRYRSTVLGQK